MDYVRNAWYVASWTQDLPAGKPLAVSILGEPIVVWRSAEGVHALEDRCVHRLAPLSLGRCNGPNLRCMYHGFLYDSSGKVKEIPGQTAIPGSAQVKAYPIVERHSWIWIWMGDSGLADEQLIPGAVGFDDERFSLGHGTLDYEAEARLICENLCDFSHLSFVHERSFKPGDVYARERPSVSALPRGVRFERWMRSVPVPEGGDEVDVWESYDFLIPGVLLMWWGSFAEGTADRCGSRRPPDLGAATRDVYFTSQAVTPLGKRKCRYFFSTGPDLRYGGATARDEMMRISHMAFAEDKEMIEGQQRILDATPTQRLLLTAHDKGVAMYNKLVKELMARDRGESPGVSGHPE